ncbi:MAG: hypothetical protein ACYTFW_05215 [Planctomycetota bacterium]
MEMIADHADAMGLNFVTVKVNKGQYDYNLRLDLVHGWMDDYIPALKAALSTKGIELWGWGDCWLINGALEARKAIERVRKFDLAGYLIDAEAQAKKAPTRFRQAEIYAEHMQELSPLPVGLCSYRYPTLHRELPWLELLQCCTHHAPQVYWIHGSNPAQQLERSITELTEIKELPFLPAGPAFSEHGWKPTHAELDEFDKACQDLNCDGVVWWECDEIEENRFEPVITAHEWPVTNEAGLTIEEKVNRLWNHHPELHQLEMFENGT